MINKIQRKLLGKIAHKLQGIVDRESKKIITVGHLSRKRGRALVSYIKEAITANNSDLFLYHSNYWECREIVSLLAEMGFDVDVIDYSDSRDLEDPEYDVVFDIHGNLSRFAPFVPRNAIKLLHMTGSYPLYSIAKELDRIRALEKRRDCYYVPKRIVDFGYFQKSLEIANRCSLLGNAYTLASYPVEFKHKVTLISPTASYLKAPTGIEANITYRKKNFVWYYGFGAVHKGLDLLLEIFSRRNDINLHICGNIYIEKDFMKIYSSEINRKNIFMHGYLRASSPEFSTILRECGAFIAPSCSEGTSAAAITCIMGGLYPILSIDNGIDLPIGHGISLRDCSIDSIETAINSFISMPDNDIYESIRICLEDAKIKYSRENFTDRMSHYLRRSLGLENT